MKPYRKIYYSNQLRVFETDTKYKTIGVQLVTGELSFESGVIAILAQGQVDMNNLLETFLESSQMYSDDYLLTVRIFRWSYSISFTVKGSAPSVSFIVNQFLFDYGFDLENFTYTNRFIDLSDIWYLVQYCSNRQFFSFYISAEILLSNFLSRSDFKINI